MKKSLIFALCLFVGVALVLTGCGKSAAEKAAEKTIEKATNGSADVDLDSDTITVNTNAGSWTAGEEVSLPAGFPSDIHVIDGTVKVATTIKENEAYSVSVESTKSVSEAKAEYEEALAADGWTINVNMTIGEMVSLGAEKGDRTVNVAIGKTDEGKIQVTIATSTQEDTEETDQE